MRPRLSRVEIELPPLRTRREDIELLARHFLDHHARRLDRPAAELTGSALRRLEEHDWPGNVRELEMLSVRLLVTTSSGSPIDVDHVREHLPKPQETRLFSEELLAGRDLKDLKRELERSYLVRLFRENFRRHRRDGPLSRYQEAGSLYLVPTGRHRRARTPSVAVNSKVFGACREGCG